VAKRFRVFFAPDDLKRLERLRESLEIDQNLGVVRVALERCMTRYPGPESITKEFRQQCDAALSELSGGAVTTGTPSVLALGNRYMGYVEAMKGPLGFPYASRMVRSVLLMFDRGII